MQRNKYSVLLKIHTTNLPLFLFGGGDFFIYFMMVLAMYFGRQPVGTEEVWRRASRHEENTSKAKSRVFIECLLS